MYISRSLTRNIKLTIHSAKRLKERAGLNTKKKRADFVRGVMRNGLLLFQIPKDDKFRPFINYMHKEVQKTKEKDSYCKVYFYQRYFVIVSLTGFIITVLKIKPPEYKDIFNDILSEIGKNK